MIRYLCGSPIGGCVVRERRVSFPRGRRPFMFFILRRLPPFNARNTIVARFSDMRKAVYRIIYIKTRL